MKRLLFLLLVSSAANLLQAQQLKLFKQDDKYGFKDPSGNVVVPAQFGTAEFFNSEGLAKVGNPQGSVWKYGMVDQTGKLVIRIQYDKIGRVFSSGLILASTNGKYGFLNKSGAVAVPFKYEAAASFSDGLAAVKLNGKWGFIDTKDVVKIQFVYDHAADFAGNLSLVTLGSKKGFIDNTGKHVTEIKYDDIQFGHMAATLYAAKMNGKYAILNRQGVEITKFIFNDASPNFDNKRSYIPVLAGMGWGVVNEKGTMSVPATYQGLIFLNDKLASAKLNGKWGVINMVGETLLPFNCDQMPEVAFYKNPQVTFIVNGMRRGFSFEGEGIKIWKYDYIGTETEGRRAVYYNKKSGFINSKGQEVVALKYDSVGGFRQGLAIVASGGKFGLIDSSGKELTALKYNYIGQFAEGLAAVASDNKWGYIELSGKEMIPLQFDGGTPFSEGMAAVASNKKVGFINRRGEMIIKPQYDDVLQIFQDGKAVVIKGKKEIVIEKTGKEVME